MASDAGERRSQQQTTDQIPPPMSVQEFSVVVAGLEIGTFSGCEGLSAEYSFEEISEGGNNAYIYKLPGRVKYQTIKLTRPITKDSAKLATWFSKFQQTQQKRATATITLYSPDGPVCTWTLREVHPSKWTGPTFSSDTSGVAKETLELVHHGFVWKSA